MVRLTRIWHTPAATGETCSATAAGSRSRRCASEAYGTVDEANAAITG
jgi:cob(I)alamin adenosyltransferase